MRTSLKRPTKNADAVEIEPGEAAEPRPEQSEALIVRPSLTPARYVADVDAEGEFSADDDIRPTMVIVAKTGARSDLFVPGSILFNGEFVIGDTKNPVEIAGVFKIKKRYQNDLPIASDGEFGDVVDRAEEIYERGGVLEYRPFEDKESTHYWMPMLQILWLVKQPKDLAPDAATLFPFEIGDSNYAIAGYTARTKTAYNGVAKVLIDAKKKRGTVRELAYRLTTKGENFHDHSWIQANLRATGEVSDEVTKFMEEND